MSQSEKPFSVSDRRHFTPEGQPRDEPAPESSAGRPPAATPEAGASIGAGGGHGKERVGGPVDLAQFLVSLGAQAGMLLAEAGGMEAAKAEEALDGARSIISILEMLRDKTEGRRTDAEDRIIDGLLYELRMTYVERARARRP